MTATHRRAVLAALASLVLTTGPAATAQTEAFQPPDRAPLIEAMRAGGHVLLIRHERTEVPARQDDYARAPNDCGAQRNLSVAGAAGAQETGIVLRALGIEPDRVLTSPMCRSAETARYMFGTEYEADRRLMHHDPDGERTLDVAVAEASELLAELAPLAPGETVALVSHGGTIARVSGLFLSEGEIAVLRLDDEGGVTAISHVMGSDLAPDARRRLANAE